MASATASAPTSPSSGAMIRNAITEKKTDATLTTNVNLSVDGHISNEELVKHMRLQKEWHKACCFTQQGQTLASTFNPNELPQEEIRTLLTAFDDRDTTVGRGVILCRTHYEVHRFHGDLIYGRRMGQQPLDSTGFALCRIKQSKNPVVNTGQAVASTTPSAAAATAAASSASSASSGSASANGGGGGAGAGSSSSSTGPAPANDAAAAPSAAEKKQEKPTTEASSSSSSSIAVSGGGGGAPPSTTEKGDFVYFVITYVSPAVSARIVPQLMNFATKFVKYIK